MNHKFYFDENGKIKEEKPTLWSRFVYLLWPRRAGKVKRITTVNGVDATLTGLEYNTETGETTLTFKKTNKNKEVKK